MLATLPQAALYCPFRTRENWKFEEASSPAEAKTKNPFFRKGFEY